MKIREDVCYNDRSTPFDVIDYDTLITKITKSRIGSMLHYYVYLEPLLIDLREEGAIEFNSTNRETKVLPKAFHLISEYYLDERRHQEKRAILNRQFWLTLILALTSAVLAGCALANLYFKYLTDTPFFSN